MNPGSGRPCPICGAPGGGVGFPYATRYNGQRFDYRTCTGCGTVFVDPTPDAATFEKMYAKEAYHDRHYTGVEEGRYAESAALLRAYLPASATVLDYGCGFGAFVRALRAQGFTPTGVEFDEAAAAHAAAHSGETVVSVADFAARFAGRRFDAIHLGDVLEHLPDPRATIEHLLGFLEPGGLLYAEGPLEQNHSPVYWAARAFGAVKATIPERAVMDVAPTHLFRVDAAQQQRLFARVRPELEPVHWALHETGWPYDGGGGVKRAIARSARALGGRTVLGLSFGNRFRGIYRRAAG